jgi:hypothetical protein
MLKTPIAEHTCAKSANRITPSLYRSPRALASNLAPEERAVTRASGFAIQEGLAPTTCSAEDLIVFKAFAGSEKDWLDIDGIATHQGGRLDQARIWTELTLFSSSRERRKPRTDCAPSSTAPAPDPGGGTPDHLPLHRPGPTQAPSGPAFPDKKTAGHGSPCPAGPA